jgi:hypothetical protein
LSIWLLPEAVVVLVELLGMVQEVLAVPEVLELI